MDTTGWHSHRKAAEEDEQYSRPERTHTGRFRPVELQAPVNNAFVGSLADSVETLSDDTTLQLDFDDNDDDDRAEKEAVPSPPQSLSAAARRARKQRHRVPPPLHPHLQVMCGPLLRYDTIDITRGVYRGACLLVTLDAGSVYEPSPTMVLEWDPDWTADTRRSYDSSSLRSHRTGVGLKATTISASLPSVVSSGLIPTGTSVRGPRWRTQSVIGTEIWVYEQEDFDRDSSMTVTFWRFIFEIPLTEVQMHVKYRINKGLANDFCVPALNGNLRWAAYSCNGFSAGVKQEDFRGPGYDSGADPVWEDLLRRHDDTPFHALVGGGDQLYCDALMREPELQEWVTSKDTSLKKRYELTKEIASTIDRFYFNHYCRVFRTGAFARANSSIPMVNMLDDHDLIDGFGSYPDDLQSSPIFRAIGSRGYFYFLLFQCFIAPDIDGMDRKPAKHTFQSTIIGGDGAYIPYRSHSFLSYMGPKISLLMLDCRAERRKDQVCSVLQYQHVLDSLYRLPNEVEHLIVQLGIPIAYPRMNFLESALDTKFNPLVALGRKGSLGLSSMVNKFNAEAELLDDLNDHWTSKAHKKERNELIQLMQALALAKRLRITFLSGDVHCAAVGLFKTLTKPKEMSISPGQDYRYMLNVVTSAIVNTPPPNPVLTMVGFLANKEHKTMHYADTDECMVPLFKKDVDGTLPKSKFIMGRRNYCSVEYDSITEGLEFRFHIERKKGIGETVEYEFVYSVLKCRSNSFADYFASYLIVAPAPRWKAKTDMVRR